MALQSPKWGAEAARFMWKRQQDGRLLGMCVGTICLLALQADTDRPAIIGLLIGLGCLGVLTGIRAAQWWQRMNLAASKTLGIEISWKPGHAPPRKPRTYEKWCERNQLTPYSASE